MLSTPYSDSSAPSGLLLVDKPQDFTSHDVVALCRRVSGIKKIGHSGTLDPLATGLLLILVGRSATKQQDKFLKLSKIYAATLTLGQETDSWDAYGTVTRQLPIPPLTQGNVEKATQKLSGTVTQPIPFFSAKKVNGRPMYTLARRGNLPERKYNQVTVTWQDVRLLDAETITFTVHCSCGTYVRSLGYLLAQALGTCGHLTALRRLQIGPYCVKDAWNAAQLKQAQATQFYTRIIPL